MDRLKFTYKNYGLMKMGYDISMLKLDLTKNSFGGNLNVEVSTGKLKIIDEMYNVVNKENRINVNDILDKLGKIEFPEETNFVEKGCDGFKWEIEVDDKKYEGYMCYPDFYKEVVKIIDFDRILNYYTNKLQEYLS